MHATYPLYPAHFATGFFVELTLEGERAKIGPFPLGAFSAALRVTLVVLTEPARGKPPPFQRIAPWPPSPPTPVPKDSDPSATVATYSYGQQFDAVRHHRATVATVAASSYGPWLPSPPTPIPKDSDGSRFQRGLRDCKLGTVQPQHPEFP